MTANVITYRGRSAAREVGKALGIDEAQIDRLAKVMGHFEFRDQHDTLPAPSADAVLRLALLPQDRGGRSRVEASMEGAVRLSLTHTRIHGSGPQRQRRAAFAALDIVRRAFG